MSTIDVGGRRLRISNEDKVFYPELGLTKQAVVEYYLRVAEAMVPHLRGRPLTLRRFPDGIQQQGWFQKQAAEHFPGWLRVVDMPRRGEGDAVRHVVCDDPATLVYLADQATIEFHVWTSTVDNRDYPDLMVIDLDPPGGVRPRRLRDAVRQTRDLLAELGLTPFLQATGGRGYHLLAPLDGDAEYDAVRALAREAADYLARRDPQGLTTAQRKYRRGHGIFLDTNRNGYAQTFIAPYSLRSRPLATAATPLDWSELDEVGPAEYDATLLPERLARRADPWVQMHAYAASARQARKRLGTMG